MSETEQNIINAALSLSPSTRAQLADMLWSSLPDELLDLPLNDEVRAAWAREAKRRMAEIESGEVQLVGGEEVMAQLRVNADQ